MIPAVCLAVATIYGEAAGEPYQGKLAVGEVIRNRMKRKHWSDGTVAGTVLRPRQFSLWNTETLGRIRTCRLNTDDPVVRECQRAWDESALTNVTSGALYYHADYVLPPWVGGMELTVQIGRHLFYVPKPKPKTPATTPATTPSDEP